MHLSWRSGIGATTMRSLVGVGVAALVVISVFVTVAMNGGRAYASGGISAVGSLAQSSGTGITTLSVDPVTTGDAWVLSTVFSDANSQRIVSVSGGGATWQAEPFSATYSDEPPTGLAQWLGVISTPGPSTITVAFTGPVTGMADEFTAQEFTNGTGPSTTWTGDVTGGTGGNYTDTVAFHTLTPSVANQELYVGFASTLSPTTAGSTPGFTYDITANGDPFVYDTDVTGAVSPTAQQAVSGPYETTATTIYAEAAIPFPLSVTTASLSVGATGAPYSTTLRATGGVSPYTWSVTSGSLPGGLALDPNTGIISGDPTSLGTSDFTVQVTDSSTPTAQTATASLSITIQKLAITTTPDLTGFVHSQFTASLSAVGGNPPYTWKLAPGSKLPKGLKLNKHTGVISGIPRTAGEFTFTIEVFDKKTMTKPHTQNTADVTFFCFLLDD